MERVHTIYFLKHACTAAHCIVFKGSLNASLNRVTPQYESPWE